ncbi:GerMN domain-containing protein [Alkalibacterium olivapovliticus]|uniref:Sporulation and spore germination protein n=1 Tax=Alkalibacterium olivapovliticus TaxID=99907 RepID=A0A2T0WBN9_9LACT|nr:GerMN domain-containing protein [Alkalibacterium olivapovliticus]PRY84122.1 sporulation and spore germination protein [Alkalibacterium olivapovliticus]
MLKKKYWMIATSFLLLAGCQAEDDNVNDDPPQEDNQEEIPEENTEDTNDMTDITEADDETNDETDISDEENVSQELMDWMPLLENVEYVYTSDYGEEALDGYTTSRYPQFNSESTQQFSIRGYENTTVNIYEHQEDAVVNVFSREETFFRDNFLETDYPSPVEEQPVLQLPIEEGNSWSGSDNAEFEITDTQVMIETPVGSFESIEVTMTQGDLTEINYYAEGIGLVQQTIAYNEEGADPSEVTLIEINEDVPEMREITLYPLDAEGMSLIQQQVTLNLYTNENQIDPLTDLLRESGLFTENAQINSMYLDTQGVIQLDINQAFIDESSAGSGIESLIIQGIVNTVSQLYGSIPSVALSIDGGPYTSGHITFEENEVLEPDFENVIIEESP